MRTKEVRRCHAVTGDYMYVTIPLGDMAPEFKATTSNLLSVCTLHHMLGSSDRAIVGRYVRYEVGSIADTLLR